MSSRRYAKGYNSKAECQRCGFKMNYSDLLNDGQVPGLRVCDPCWEPWHPQLDPIPADDAIALYRPSPDISKPDDSGDPAPPICFGNDGEIVFPSASFTYVDTNGSVAFTNTSNPECAPETAWSWDFGDGQSSVLEDPTNAYALDGTYTVVLTTTFTGGYQGTDTQTVTITVIFNDWLLLPVQLGAAGNIDSARKNIATDEAGTWLSIDSNAYISKSTDDGITWAQVSIQGYNSGNNTPRALATNKSGVWMAGNFGGYAARSTDDGVTWVVMARYLGMNALSVDINTITSLGGTRWIAGGTAGYASISTDNGATWTQISPIGLNALVIGASFDTEWDGANGILRVQATIFAARSIDNGANWTGVTIPISAHSIASYGAGKYVITGTNGTWSKSEDFGATWTASAQISTETETLKTVTVLSDGTWIALTGGTSNKRMWVSTDEGVSWVNVTGNLPTMISGDFFVSADAGAGGTYILVASNRYSIRTPST